MGNTESMSQSQHEFYYQHPPNYDGSSVSNSYHQPSSYTGSLDSTTYDQPSAYTGNLGNTNHHQPSSHATSSVNTRHHHNKQPTYIADNFSSLDQVFTVNFVMWFMEHISSKGVAPFQAASIVFMQLFWRILISLHMLDLTNRNFVLIIEDLWHFQVVSALREAGLESSNLILGIDFTKSNEWTG